MSNADTTGGEDSPETVQINLRLSKAFLEDIDATWQEGVQFPERISSPEFD